jgi:NAD(P)-dependent dehydrogenase (short-subunit alcohol dehydrogenase family)
MIKTNGVRIVNVSSIAHTFCKKLDLDDLTFERNPAAEKFLHIYGITKLCNILFTKELAKKLEPLGIK